MPITPDKAHFYPGYPPVCWDPHLASSWSVLANGRLWKPGLAAWNRSERVWYELSPGRALGNTVPDSTVLLVPEHSGDNAANLAARIDTLEQVVRDLRR